MDLPVTCEKRWNKAASFQKFYFKATKNHEKRKLS
jgi:hypothetical protein